MGYLGGLFGGYCLRGGVAKVLGVFGSVGGSFDSYYLFGGIILECATGTLILLRIVIVNGGV